MHEQEGKTYFNDMTVFAFSRTVLLVCMWTRNMMINAYASKERIEFFILSSPVTLDCNDFLVKLTFNKFLEFLEDREDFGFELKQVYPCKFTIVINKANIIFLSSKRISGMTHH